MPFDGITVYSVTEELKKRLTGGRIDKVYQPENDQIVLNIRSLGRMYHLLLSASAGSARCQLTEKKIETPLQPPAFCMLLRKHLTGGKILEISQVHFDRIVEIVVEAMDELGDLKKKSLILEVMGKHSNLVLVDENRRILDAIRHVSITMSSVRQIGPGLTYVLPAHNHKINPMEWMLQISAQTGKEKAESLDKAFEASSDAGAQGVLVKALYTVFSGFSPLASREILFRAGIEDKEIWQDLTPERRGALVEAMTGFLQQLKHGDMAPVMYLKEDGSILDFSLFPYDSLRGIDSRSYPDLMSLLDDYFAGAHQTDVLKQKAQDLRHLLTTNLDRVRRKLALQEKQMEDTRDREEYRINGDLITANVYQLKQGMTSCDLPDYYQESMPLRHIHLDVNLTPAQNAQKYYSRYNKMKRTEEALRIQIAEGREEEAYLLSVVSALNLSDCEQDLMDIRQELSANGYLKKAQKGKKNLARSKPLEFVTSEGVQGLVGKNNIQNDQLTFRSARDRDEWFHVKNIPGSHVILKIQGLEMGRDYTEQSFLEAAAQAARHSSGREGSNVPVDHTRVMYVKKPAGSKPGFVRYTHEQTIFVPADEIGKIQ